MGDALGYETDTLYVQDRREETVPIELDLEDQLEMGNELAAKEIERDQVEEEKKEAAKDYGEKIKALESRIRHLAECLDQGSEERVVDVDEVLDYSKGVVFLRPLDHPEMRLKERPMTTEERTKPIE